MNFIKLIILSALIHSSMLTFSWSSENKGKGNSNRENINLFDKGSNRNDNKIEINIVEKKTKNINKQKTLEGSLLVEDKLKELREALKKEVKEDNRCDRYYFGVGVETDWNCTVTRVYAGYPADINGLRVGDHVLSPSCIGIRGEEGSILNIKIMRKEEILELSLKREKICGTW